MIDFIVIDVRNSQACITKCEINKKYIIYGRRWDRCLERNRGDSIDAIICTVDLLIKDSEIKILIGCSEDEKRLIIETHNNSDFMKGILMRRDKE